ncbi:MAG: NnrU family protein [Alphaproteobacteria bacterium]|nr:NnrU family protein [Alphaproteobacteria bacterium]
MTTLLIGLSLFFLLHFVPVYANGTRNKVASKIGELPYKGLFALASLAGLYLVYKGWTTSTPTQLYSLPAWAFHATGLFVLIGFVLFFAARAPTNIKRVVRHPQLTGVVFWAIGHLLVNGDTRSFALFGGFTVWALLTMFGANRRDGEWKKPEKVGFVKDAITVAIGVALYVVFVVWAHEWLFGMKPMG